jgi:hypothetical protein
MIGFGRQKLQLAWDWFATNCNHLRGEFSQYWRSQRFPPICKTYAQTKISLLLGCISRKLRFFSSNLPREIMASYSILKWNMDQIRFKMTQLLIHVNRPTVSLPSIMSSHDSGVLRTLNECPRSQNSHLRKITVKIGSSTLSLAICFNGNVESIKDMIKSFGRLPPSNEMLLFHEFTQWWLPDH